MLKVCSNKACLQPEKELREENFRICKYRDGTPYYKARCRDCEREKAKIYGNEHAAQRGKNNKKFRDLNPEYKKQWKEKNREANNRKDADKRQSDPAYRLRKNVSRAVSDILKASGSSKKGQSILKYLNYTIEQLIMHIEVLFLHPDNLVADGIVWMNWQNHGHYRKEKWDDNDPSTWRWQLDHIIPQSELPYDNMEHLNFQKCWALNNLRPLSAKQNILDGAYHIRHKRV